jgi:hypothetical protein
MPVIAPSLIDGNKVYIYLPLSFQDANIGSHTDKPEYNTCNQCNNFHRLKQHLQD